MIDNIQAMPSAIMAEKAVICCMLRQAQLYSRGKAEGIDFAAFHFPTTRILFDLMETSQRDTNGEIDLITAVHSLNDTGDLAKAGGPSAISEVFSYVPNASGWSNWTEQLREMKARRLAMLASERIKDASDSTEAIQEAKNALAALTGAIAGQKRAITAKQAAQDFADRFESDHHSGDIPGKSTGLTQLDAISGGMRPGEFWVVGGKPSRGKSVLMLQIAAEFMEREEPVAVFSLEMMAHEIVGRLVSVVGRVNYGAITQPRTAMKGDLLRIQSTCMKIGKSPLWIDSSAGQTTDSILSEAERIRDAHGGISLVVVDYLQLIRGGRGRNESREEEIARASGGLKQLAKLLGCPVLSASQLNENGQTRESRAIEQDADALLYIVEDGVKIGKLRNGRRDDLLPLILDGSAQKFVIKQP